jgi:biopolymer transport protein TolR
MAMGLASGRRGRGGGRRAPMAEINVTPLVDVMLVLLIIFMVTAPLLTSGVPLDLPDSRANAIEPDPDQITLSVDKQGAIYLDDERLEPGTLGVRLDAVLRQAGGKPPLVTVRADGSVDYARVMAVMGELNRSGFKAISLVTNSSQSEP